MINFLIMTVAIWIYALTYLLIRISLKRSNVKLLHKSYLRFVILVTAITVVQFILVEPLINNFRSEIFDTTEAILGLSFGLITAGIFLYKMGKAGMSG